jgi:hypothetical protein
MLHLVVALRREFCRWRGIVHTTTIMALSLF